MNDLAILKQTAQTMSSREIAQLCQKPHDNVLKLVRSLIDGGIVKSTTPHQYMHPQNSQWYTEFLSDKRDSLVIVARLSPEFTAAVIDRWQELETQLPRELSRLEILQIALQAEQEKIALECKVNELQPKADALYRISHAIGNQNVRDTAKTLDKNQNQFVDWCLKNDWLYRDDASRLKAYQHRINQGFMAQKSVIYKGQDGAERVTMQPMFTPKGITHLANKFKKAVA